MERLTRARARMARRTYLHHHLGLKEVKIRVKEAMVRRKEVEKAEERVSKEIAIIVENGDTPAVSVGARAKEIAKEEKERDKDRRTKEVQKDSRRDKMEKVMVEETEKRKKG